MDSRRPARRTPVPPPQGGRAAAGKPEPGAREPKARPSRTRARPQPESRDATRSGSARTRAPGRPAAAGPELRARLLDAALACFVRSGIAATPLRAIATEAGVTPALVHYYFGD